MVRPRFAQGHSWESSRLIQALTRALELNASRRATNTADIAVKDLRADARTNLQFGGVSAARIPKARRAQIVQSLKSGV